MWTQALQQEVEPSRRLTDPTGKDACRSRLQRVADDLQG